MHLNTAVLLVADGPVAECVEIEVAAEFGVDAAQKVQVESGGDAERIVIGSQQRLLGFHQVCSQQEQVARLYIASQPLEKIGDCFAFEIADGTAQEEQQQLIACRSLVP